MKKISLLLFLATVIFILRADATVRTTVASGNWNSTSVWGGPIPQANDDVVITSGNTVTINVNPANIMNVTISGTLQFDATGTGRVWTVAGNFTVNSGGSFICVAPGTATIHTLNYNGINLSNSGTFNMVNGSNKSNVIVGGAVTQQIGGSSTCTFNKLTINNTGGLVTITSGTGVFSIAESNPTKLVGNIITNDSLVIQRGLLVAGGLNSATITHTIANLKMGSGTSKISSSTNIFTQLVSITLNTSMTVNDATNSNVTMNVTGSFTSPNMTQANSAITVSLVGPTCQGGENNATTLSIGGVTNIPDLISINGNSKAFGGVEPKRPDLIFNGDVTLEYNKSHTVDVPFTSDDIIIRTFFFGRVDSLGTKPRIILNGGTTSTPNNWNVVFEVFNSPIQVTNVFGTVTEAQISESAADWVINGNWKIPTGDAITVHCDDTLHLNGSVRVVGKAQIAGSDNTASTAAGPEVKGPLLIMSTEATVFVENPDGLGDGALSDSLLNVAIINRTSGLDWDLTTISSHGSVNYDAAANQTITDRSYNNLLLKGSTNKTLSGNTTINGTLTIDASAKLINAGFNSTTMGAVVNNGNHSGTGKIILAGSANQSLSGTGTEWGNVQLNSSAGATCLNDLTTTGTINFDAGILTTSSSAKLVLGASGNYTGGSAASHVSGPMSKSTASTTEFVFPVGKGGTYRQISVKPSSTSATTYTAEYFNSAFSNTASVQAPITSVSTIEYWQLDRNSGTANAKVKLFWGPSSGFADTIGLRVAKWNGTKWTNAGKTASTGNTSNGSITSTTVTSFSPFTFGRTTVATQSITTNTITGSPFCPEATLNVPFTSTGTYNAGNIYTAQLSSASGSFTAPTSIGTLSSTANSGSIASAIPVSTASGSGYRIRVVSSNPVVTGTDNGSNLNIQACAKPTGLAATGITSSGATVSWNAVACAAKYKLQYRKQGTTAFTSATVTSPSKVLTGLTANTTYEYKVQTYCTSSGSTKSKFTALSTFTTSTLKEAAVTLSTAASLKMYPNPTSAATTLEIYSPVNESALIMVSNTVGQTMLSQAVMLTEGTNSFQVAVNDLPSGVYFVEVKAGDSTMTQKLVKE